MPVAEKGDRGYQQGQADQGHDLVWSGDREGRWWGALVLSGPRAVTVNNFLFDIHDRDLAIPRVRVRGQHRGIPHQNDQNNDGSNKAPQRIPIRCGNTATSERDAFWYRMNIVSNMQLRRS